MATEDLTGTKYLNNLNSSNPASSDAKSFGDEHLRGIKNTLKLSFPGITGAVTATHEQLNHTVGVTSAIQTQLGALTTSVGTKQATLVNITDTTTANGFGTRTISTSSPSAGSNGDVHYQV
jgi:hypothetical protein